MDRGYLDFSKRDFNYKKHTNQYHVIFCKTFKEFQDKAAEYLI